MKLKNRVEDTIEELYEMIDNFEVVEELKKLDDTHAGFKLSLFEMIGNDSLSSDFKLLNSDGIEFDFCSEFGLLTKVNQTVNGGRTGDHFEGIVTIVIPSTNKAISYRYVV